MKYVLMFTSRPDLDAEIDPEVMKADYKRIYGETAPKPDAVALSIDTNDTRASAVARFGRIAFVAR